MVTAALAAGALALLAWPGPAARRRLSCTAASAVRWVRMPSVPPHRLAVAGAVAGALVVVLLAGLAVGIASALLAGAAVWLRRSRRRARHALGVAETLAEALRTMVAELRAGAHPSVAARSAATGATGEVADLVRAVADSARLGGELDADLLAERAPNLGSAPAHLTRAWSLAHEHGLPLAGVLEAVQLDVEANTRLANQVQARMAGPRASAMILGALPVAGVALGEAMGAAPLDVLLQRPLGQLLLVAGCALIFAGTAWSMALTGRVPT